MSKLLTEMKWNISSGNRRNGIILATRNGQKSNRQRLQLRLQPLVLKVGNFESTQLLS